MSKKEIDPETASQIKKELAELRAQLENQKKSKKKACLLYTSDAADE